LGGYQNEKQREKKEQQLFRLQTKIINKYSPTQEEKE
jgi:hypothetical protein